MKKYVFLASALSLLLMACQKESTPPASGEEPAPAAAKAGGEEHADEIVLTPAQAKAAGIETQRVEPGDFYGIIATGGKILEASGDEATLVASSSGTVSFARGLAEGTAVSKGSTLFTISASHLQNGDPSQHARVAYEAAKREYERAQKLVKDRIITEREFNTARANYQSARINYEATPERGGKGVNVKASLTGYVKACLVKEGDYVTVGQPLMSLTQNRRLYLKADVPERYFGQLHEISSAKFQPSYSSRVYDLQALGGRLLAYGRTATDASPYIPVTFEFNNAAGLIPGAFVEVKLLTRKRSQVISLPVEALTEEQGTYFVYLRNDEGNYLKREVTPGASDGQRIEITHGLKGGEEVVTRGAMHVKLASASNVIPAHTHEH